MWIKSNMFFESNGAQAITVNRDVLFHYAMKTPMVVEAPVRIMGGGMIGCEHLGAFTYINKNADIRHISSIGRFCAIAPNMKAGYPQHATQTLCGHNLFYRADPEWTEAFHSLYEDIPEKETWIATNQEAQSRELQKYHKRITIGNDVWIGGDVTVARGVTIGDGAVLGTGALVVKDVPPYSIVGGIPARVIRYRFSEDIIQRLLAVRWWRFGPDILQGLPMTDLAAALPVLEERAHSFPEYRCDRFELCPDGTVTKIDADGNRTPVDVTEQRALES